MTFLDDAKEFAIVDVEKYNHTSLFNTALKKGMELAKKFKADEEIVFIGCCFMDLKLGQCIKEGRLKEHVKESEIAAEEFLKKHKYPDNKIKKVLECIREHHGVKKFSSKESEICCNADCYKFLLPSLIIDYILVLGERKTPIKEIVLMVEYKVDEKWNALSMDFCKKELKSNYEVIKKFLEEAKK